MGEWIDTTIGEQVTLQRGIDITKVDQREGLIPVISSGGTSSYHDTAAASGPGVVLGRKGVIGSVYYVQSDYWPHDTTLWVKNFHDNEPRFVYYFFRWMTRRLGMMDVGSANPTLNRNHVYPIRIRWPESIFDQDAIASILGALDDKIDLNRRMNETLEAMARAIFKDWFMHFGPTRAIMEGRAPYLAPDVWSLFPDRIADKEPPRGWRVESLLDHANLISGGTPKTDEPAYWNGPIEWASAKDVSQCSDAFLISTERSITQRGLNESATRIIPKFSTVVVARGATTGRHCMFGRDMAMNQTCYALSSSRGRPFWLNCAFESLVAELVHAAHGSVFDTITTRTLQGALCAAPDAPLLDRFESLVQPLFLQVLANVEQSRTLAGTRDLLLPKLMSGEIRVREAEKAIEAAA